MKKKVIMAGAAVIMSAVAVGFSANTNNKMTDVMSANLEALTRNESGGTWTCESRIKENPDNRVFYCGTCDWVENSAPTWWSSTNSCTR